jgi:ubiquitin carboxyl-terminal hydrolase 1
MHSHQKPEGGFFDHDPSLEYHQDYRDGIQRPYARVGFVLPFLICLIPLIYQILVILDYNVLSLPELVWNILVYITPTRILDAIDDYQNPLRISNPALKHIPRTHAAKSEVMRRILGLDTPGGVIASVASASRRRLSVLPGVKMLTASNDGGPAGLGNWDNSCYQNSVLQGLASLEPMTEYLTNPNVDTEAEEGISVPETKMAEALRGLISTLNDPNSNRKTFWTPATLKNMSSWQQQDAQEYFSKILDEIDKEMGSVARAVRRSKGFQSDDASSSSGAGPEESSANVYRNPLEGLMAQRVGCMTCGYSEGLQMVPFNCLTVPLTKAWSQSINDCLDEVTKLEHIPGVECGKCTLLRSKNLLSIVSERNKDDEGAHARTLARLAVVEGALEDDDYEDKTLVQKCKIPAKSRVTSTKTRQAVIARPPRSLVVHFNRSVFDEMTGELRKNHAEVRFPKSLDLGPWCLGSGGTQVTSTLEEWQLDPEKPMIASSIRPSRIKGPIYELRAVVTHYGRHENGHYICYKKHPVVMAESKSDTAVLDNEKKPEEQWWRLSDDDVMKSSEQNVLAQGGVFMLFYDCVEPSSIVDPSTASSRGPVAESQPGTVDHEFKGAILENYASPLPPNPQSSVILDSNGAPAAAEIALPTLDDSDLSDYDNTLNEGSIATATSISEYDDDDDPAPQHAESDYKPTQPIVVSPYVPQSGGKASKDGTSLEGSTSNLLMV